VDGIPGIRKTHPLEVGDAGSEDRAKRAGRRINNACKEARESRAALARMKYLGTFLTGVKQATDK
jgi:hypothetical protein